MNPSVPNITPTQAAHVLWLIGEDGGYQPGNFVEKLLDAFHAADPTNHALLALGFPGEAEAMRIAGYRTGAEMLRHIFAGRQVEYMIVGGHLLWSALHAPDRNSP